MIGVRGGRGIRERQRHTVCMSISMTTNPTTIPAVHTLILIAIATHLFGWWRALLLVIGAEILSRVQKP